MEKLPTLRGTGQFPLLPIVLRFPKIFLKTMRVYYNAQLTVNLVTRRPTLRVGSLDTWENHFSYFFIFFFQKYHSSKNSADDRAPPKPRLLTLFIAFLGITFDTLTDFS